MKPRQPRTFWPPLPRAVATRTLAALLGVALVAPPLSHGQTAPAAGRIRGSEPVTFRDISDGASNTLVVGEAARANIPWMKPIDVDVTAHPSIGDPDGFGSYHVGGAQFLMADGSVRFIAQSISAQTLQALFTRDGGEAIPPGEY